MPRFFVSPTAFSEDGTAVAVTGEDAHHIARSLRLAVGDILTVCDGAGTVYTCRLTLIRDDRAEAEILGSAPTKTEPPFSLRLFMAYPKGDKFETVLQKAVELGATRVTPFESARCVKRPPKEKQARLTERHARIAEEAAKQCGRGRVPAVDPPLSFEEMVCEATRAELPLFCYEGGGTLSLRAVLTSREMPASVAVIVGAEGGFSEHEAKTLCEAGAIPVNLGPRILRCETAPAYVLSALSYAFELPDSDSFC